MTFPVPSGLTSYWKQHSLISLDLKYPKTNTRICFLKSNFKYLYLVGKSSLISSIFFGILQKNDQVMKYYFILWINTKQSISIKQKN